MDPFEGGDGLRANINGNKCIMYDIPGNVAGAGYTVGNVFTFQTADILLRNKLDNQSLRFKLTVTDDASLEPGVKYSIGEGGNTASLGYVEGSSTALSGWIVFLRIGSDSSTTEARFELYGKTRDQEFDVRHGFLRLFTENHREQ